MNAEARAQAPNVAVLGVAWTSLPVSLLASGGRRLEAEAYLTGGFGIRQRIAASGVRTARLDDIADVWQPSRLKGIGVSQEDGVPFLTATQVFDVRPTPRKWFAPGRTPELGRRFLERGWIVVTRSGNVGDCLMVYGPHPDSAASDTTSGESIPGATTEGGPGEWT